MDYIFVAVASYSTPLASLLLPGGACARRGSSCGHSLAVEVEPMFLLRHPRQTYRDPRRPTVGPVRPTPPFEPTARRRSRTAGPAVAFRSSLVEAMPT